MDDVEDALDSCRALVRDGEVVSVECSLLKTDYCQADCGRKERILLKTTCSSVFVLNRRRDCSVLARWIYDVFF